MKSYSSDLPKIEEFIELNGKTLLEIGCGDGRLTALLADKADAITAAYTVFERIDVMKTDYVSGEALKNQK